MLAEIAARWGGRSTGTAPTPPLHANHANLGDAGVARTVRGGSWADDAAYQTNVFRMHYDPTTTYSDLGFRCARAL